MATAVRSSCRKTLEQRPHQRVRRVVGSRAGPAPLPGDSSGLGKALLRVRPVDMSTRLTRSSTYDLEAFDPGLSISSGSAGSRASWSRGPGARGVSESRVATSRAAPICRTGSPSRLPRADADDAAAARGRRPGSDETKQREFPVGSVRWSHTFRGGPLALVAVGTTFRRRQGSSLQSAAPGPGRSGTQSRTITPDIQLGSGTACSVTLGFNTLDQDNRSNGNETRLDQNDITGGSTTGSGCRARSAAPETGAELATPISRQPPGPASCRARDECIVVSDVRRREMRGGLDTDLLQTLPAGSRWGIRSTTRGI